MNNPRTKHLQYLNDNIGKSMWMLTTFKDGCKSSGQIKVRDHAHALKLFESQQTAFRVGDKIEFDELPY